MLTVTYPPTILSVKAYVVDQEGFIIREVMMPMNAATDDHIVCQYLPAPIRKPRWDGTRWVDESPWYRRVIRWWRTR